MAAQMENNAVVSSNPREITNRIKDFFYSPRAGNEYSSQPRSYYKRSKQEIELFSIYINSNKNELDAVNAILIIEGCHRSQNISPKDGARATSLSNAGGINIKDICGWPVLLRAMEKSSPHLTSSMIYRGISSMKYANLEKDLSQKKFLVALLARVKESGILLNVNDLCPAIYNLQSHSSNSPEIRSLVEYIAKSMAMLSKDKKVLFSAKSVCSAIYGLKKMKSVPEVRHLLSEIEKCIDLSDAYYHSVNVCIALNGLQHMDDTYPEVRRLLSLLMDKVIAPNEQGLDKAKDREISMALFGLQKMGSNSIIVEQSSSQPDTSYSTFSPNPTTSGPSGDFIAGQYHLTNTKNVYLGRHGVSPELRRVLKYLTDLLEHFDQPFEAKRLGFAMNGLTRLSTHTEEVTALVYALAKRSTNAWGDISGQELSMCMRGLMNLGSDSPAVRSLLSTGITPLIKKCARITANDARSGLYGIQGLHTPCKDVNALCDAFADLLTRSQIIFTTPAEISHALYGLQGIDSTTPQGKKLICKVIKMIPPIACETTTKDPPAATVKAVVVGGETAGSVSSSMKANGASHSSRTAVPLLSPIVPAVVAGTTAFERGQCCEYRHFTSRDLAMSFYGLRGMASKVNGHSEALTIIELLTPYVQDFRGVLVSQNVASILYGLQGLKCSTKEIREAIDALAYHIDKTKGVFDPKGLSMSLAGLQGFSSKTPEVLLLVNGLAVTMERTWTSKEQTFRGFEDFHQISSSLYGLSLLSSNAPEVQRMVNALAALIIVSRSKKSKSSSNIASPERVAMALHGMQRLSVAQCPSVNTLWSVLGDYIEAMPACRNPQLACMAMQGFRGCVGTPSPEQEKALDTLVDRMQGWGLKGDSVEGGGTKKDRQKAYWKANKAVGGLGKSYEFKGQFKGGAGGGRAGGALAGATSVPHNQHELEATLRGVLGGIKKMDQSNPAVKKTLAMLAVELTHANSQFDLDHLEKATLMKINDVYSGSTVVLGSTPSSKVKGQDEDKDKNKDEDEDEGKSTQTLSMAAAAKKQSDAQALRSIPDIDNMLFALKPAMDQVYIKSRQQRKAQKKDNPNSKEEQDKAAAKRAVVREFEGKSMESGKEFISSFAEDTTVQADGNPLPWLWDGI